MIMNILIIILLILSFTALFTNAASNGTTLFLGGIALSAPYIAGWLTKKYFAPDLHIEYLHKPPYFRQTRYAGSLPVYYCQFCVENKGKSQAKSCEAVLEELQLRHSHGKFVKVKNFLPVNLTWATEYSQPGGGAAKTLLENINQNRKKYCNIGHIPHSKDQKAKSVFYNNQKTESKFFFDMHPKSKAQPDCILPGKAKIKIGIYADNAPKNTRYFIIDWSGKWEDKEEDMLKEFKIVVQGEQKDKGGEKG